MLSLVRRLLGTKSAEPETSVMFGPQRPRTTPAWAGLRLPHDGQLFQAKRDLEVRVGIWFHAPFSSGCQSIFPAGEVLELDYEPDPEQTAGVALKPDRYRALEPMLVPEAVRWEGPYAGYTISVSYVQLNQDFVWLRMADVIHFYRTEDAYGCFSNFAAYPIEVGGKQWPTSEHYFQAQKFAGTEHAEAIRLAKSPMVAARMGRDRSKPLRPDWEAVKDEVMREAVRAKFTQHPELAKILLDTGDATIVEHTDNDSYWGDGGDGSGKNMLGRILMEVRHELWRDVELV